MPSCDYTYPIGAFGRTMTEKVSAETGVVFARYDHTKRRNGNQTISFTGTSIQIDLAWEQLNSAVSRHLRWREHQRKDKQMSVTTAGFAISRPSSAPTYSGSQSTSAPDKKLSKGERQSHNSAVKKGTSLDVTGLQKGLIARSKHNAWVARSDQQKAKNDNEIARYTSITGNVPAKYETASAIRFLDEYDRIDKGHLSDNEVDVIETAIGLEAFQAEGEELMTLTEMQLLIGTMDGGLDPKAPRKTGDNVGTYDEVDHAWYQSDEGEEPAQPAKSIINQCQNDWGYHPAFGTCLSGLDLEVPPRPSKVSMVLPERPRYNSPPEAHFAYNAALRYNESMKQVLA